MSPADNTKMPLDDPRINVKLKLSALWITVMFCYIYADILGLFSPWLLGEILEGRMGPLGPITQELKLGVAVMMSVPALMVYFSLTLRPVINRWANIIAGAFKTIVIALTLVMTFATEPWAYYVYYALIEIVITSYIVWCAWTWPTHPCTSHPTT